MKFFSRKALVAAAAAATISFGGAGAAMAAETPAAATSATATATPTTTKAQTPEKGGSSSFDDVDVKEVKEWIGVATAIITALGALFGFVNKYFKIF